MSHPELSPYDNADELSRIDPVNRMVDDWGQHKVTDAGAGIGKGASTVGDALGTLDKLGSGDVKGVAEGVRATATDAQSFVSELATVAADPLAALISNGLAFVETFLVPLKQTLELVTGDPEALNTSAQQFDEIALQFRELGTRLADTAAQGTSDWRSDSAGAAGQHVARTVAQLSDAAECAGHISSLLKISGMVMQAAYDIINSIIADVVEQLVITWITAQALAVETLGASEAAAATATVAEVAAGTARAGEKVSTCTRIVRQIVRLCEELRGALSSFKVVQKAARELKPAESALGRMHTAEEAIRSAGRADYGRILREGVSGRSIRDAAGNYARDQLSGDNLTQHEQNLASAVGYSTDPGAQAEQYRREHPDEPVFPAEDPDA